MYSVSSNVRTNQISQSNFVVFPFSECSTIADENIKSKDIKYQHVKESKNGNTIAGPLVGYTAVSSEYSSSCGMNLPDAGGLPLLPDSIYSSPIKQGPEADSVSREFRRVSCSQSVRELIHEMAQIQDMLIMDSTDPWADIQRRTALLDPGFREILQRHMARAAALLERIERDCQDVLSPEELAECGRLRGAFERMRGYVGADLVTEGGDLGEGSYQRLMQAMRDVAAGARDVLGAVITGLGASAAFLMNLLHNQFAH